ncbi:hypothetical protein Pan97_19570 [Bremerella volcania]|uniref:Uncharacterized protein n=1 Tax=Bremerella volcania TaxID=2527984 RepID=A0A518C6T8_9BACT|nr:hypothetical protein [Bremerella volcania]QDU74937.1 hypothetical protein Pan97_19570 [Bremerella volcania]
MFSFFKRLFSSESGPVQSSGPIEPPVIHLQPSAVEQFEALIEIDADYNLADNHIRIGQNQEIRGRFAPTISIEARGDMRPEEDFLVHSNGVTLVVARNVARHLNDTMISFVDTPGRRGFKFEGPSFDGSP